MSARSKLSAGGCRCVCVCVCLPVVCGGVPASSSTCSCQSHRHRLAGFRLTLSSESSSNCGQRQRLQAPVSETAAVRKQQRFQHSMAGSCVGAAEGAGGSGVLDLHSEPVFLAVFALD